jgi:DNA-binding MarR family transcriptional regulator
MNRLHDCVSFALVKAVKVHRNLAEAALNQLGLYVGQELVVLQLAEAPGLSQSELAARMCVEAPTMSKTLRRMKDAGIVEQQADTDDARVSRVYLTEKGRALEQPILDIWYGLDRTMIAGLTDVEKAVLRRLLMQIHANLTTIENIDAHSE